MSSGTQRLRTAAGVIDLDRPIVVGVVNATPDSFSDRGDRSTAGSIRQVEQHIDNGAGIIEIGGESNVTNRPAVTAEVETRAHPAGGRGGGRHSGPRSRSTPTSQRWPTAALAAGAAIVNDISGRRRRQAMIEVCAAAGAAMVVDAHRSRRRRPSAGTRTSTRTASPQRQVEFFTERLERLAAAGIPANGWCSTPGPTSARPRSQTVESLRGSRGCSSSAAR